MSRQINVGQMNVNKCLTDKTKLAHKRVFFYSLINADCSLNINSCSVTDEICTTDFFLN